MGPAIAAALALAAAILGYAATRRPRRAAAAQERLDRAVADVDRELAANLELTTMYDQTKQAFVLENGEFATHRDVLAAEIPAAFAAAAELYGRIPDAEAAMERRGPANSVRDEDRETVERWEGDARHLQRALRDAARAPLPSSWERVWAKLRER